MQKGKKGIGLALFLSLLMAVQLSVVTAEVKVPVATGTKVTQTAKGAIDTTNTNEGYVMAKYTGSKDKIRLIIQKEGGTSYTYVITSKDVYEAFPLTEGNGSYKVTVYENVSGTKYAAAAGTTVTAQITNQLSPFLYANQYVNFKADSTVVTLAQKMVGKEPDVMKKVKTIYEYVVTNFSYDYDKVFTVQSGYVCNIEDTLVTKKGICLDYAAVMAAMFRSQGVPTKLMVGYVGTLYHAWISVYVPEVGWVDQVIYFDGKEWNMMDPTMASTNRAAKGKTDFKPDETKYSAKYAY